MQTATATPFWSDWGPQSCVWTHVGTRTNFHLSARVCRQPGFCDAGWRLLQRASNPRPVHESVCKQIPILTRPLKGTVSWGIPSLGRANEIQAWPTRLWSSACSSPATLGGNKPAFIGCHVISGDLFQSLTEVLGHVYGGSCGKWGTEPVSDVC